MLSSMASVRLHETIPAWYLNLKYCFSFLGIVAESSINIKLFLLAKNSSFNRDGLVVVTQSTYSSVGLREGYCKSIGQGSRKHDYVVVLTLSKGFTTFRGDGNFLDAIDNRDLRETIFKGNGYVPGQILIIVTPETD